MLLCYSLALEAGDFETLDTILAQAESDPTLDHMIAEWHVAEETLIAAEEFDRDAQIVQTLAQQHLSTEEVEPAEPPPLTIREVVARLQSEHHIPRSLKEEITALAVRLRQCNEPFPKDLSLIIVNATLVAQGVTLSRPLLKLFRDTAIMLAMGHQDQANALAAARKRQQRQTPQKQEPRS